MPTLDPLTSALDGEHVAGLERLTPDQRELIASLIVAAKHEQDATLEASANDALKHVPRLLRTPVRKALGM